MKDKCITVEDWFNSAIASFGSGRFKQAIAAHQQVKRLEPGGVHDLLLTGLQQLAANRCEEALHTSEEALALEPTAVFAHTLKGIALIYLGRCQEALAALDEALMLEPGNPLATTQRAAALILLKRYEEALSISEQALTDTSRSQNLLVALMYKAAALSGLERYEEAIEAARQMIRQAPRRVEGYAALGDIFEHLGYDPEALDAYKQGLRCDIRQAGLWAHMAGVLLRLGYSGDALFAFERAEGLGCQEASCYRGKGDALMERKRYRHAADAYEQALLLEPGDQESQRKRMDALARVLPEQPGYEAARPRRLGSSRGLLQGSSRGGLPDFRSLLSSIGWCGALIVVVSIALVLALHLDARPLFKALLSVTLLPLELLAILLYPLSLALGWGHRRRTGFHPRIVRSAALGKGHLPQAFGRYVWRPPQAGSIWLRLLRANLFGVGHIIIVTAALSACSFYGLTSAVPGPLTLAIFLWGNLLVALHCLAVFCTGLLYLGESLIRGVATSLRRKRRTRGSQQHQRSERAACAEGERLLRDGEPQAALSHIDEALARHPASASLRLAKACFLERLARPRDALVCLDEALEVIAAARQEDSHGELRYDALVFKAQLLWLLERCGEALAACEEALAHFGRDPLLYSYKGLLLWGTGDWAATLWSFELAYQYAGHGAGAPVPLAFHLLNQGNALCALGRYQEAAHAYTLAKRQRDLVPALRLALFYNLACTRALLGQGEEALAFLGELDAEEGGGTLVNCARAEVLASLGRDQEAITAYKMAAPTASHIDRAETRRTLLCRLSCPLIYERPSEEKSTFRWRLGAAEPVQLQGQPDSVPPSA